MTDRTFIFYFSKDRKRRSVVPAPDAGLDC
jgi:hypothetical protein